MVRLSSLCLHLGLEFITKSNSEHSVSELKRSFIYQESDESAKNKLEAEAKQNVKSL